MSRQADSDTQSGFRDTGSSRFSMRRATTRALLDEAEDLGFIYLLPHSHDRIGLSPEIVLIEQFVGPIPESLEPLLGHVGDVPILKNILQELDHSEVCT